MQTLLLEELASLANKSVRGAHPPAVAAPGRRSLAAAPARAAAPAAAASLEPFTTTSLGGFPYFWQNPTNLEFNPRTYAWIASNLRANKQPAELDISLFVNYYIQALSQLDYSLSTADMARLQAAAQSIWVAQTALLNAWVNAFGALPAAAGPAMPIDIVLQTITTQWAAPPTTLGQLQQAADPSAALHSAPAGAKGQILPALAAYLQALGSTATLQSSVSLNRGLLAQALQSAQSPSSANGGLRTSDGMVNPAYGIRPSVSEIVAQLDSSDQINVSIAANPASPSQFSVSLNGGANRLLPTLDFLSVQFPSLAFELDAYVRANQQTTQIEMTFQGLTFVEFAPVSFDPSTGKSWFWMSPILDAIRNGGQDVSGFRFLPPPQIDFSARGPFGFVTRVGLTKYPSIQVKAPTAPEESLRKQLLSSSAARVAVADQTPAESYTASSAADPSTGAFTISLDPPADAKSVKSTAFVVGVNTHFPAT